MSALKYLAPFLFAGVVAFAASPAVSDLARSTPEAEGISSAAVQSWVEGLESKIDAVHSFVLVRHGHVVAEGWWDPYAAAEPHQLFSLSKSFTSMAVGLAISEGRLKLTDPVLSFFPTQAPASPSDNLKALRIRDLLTMSTGHHEDAIKDFPFGASDDLVARFLALPIAHKPGTFFVYNTPATYVLSAIVQKVTGQTVLEYLRPRLFDPLGIKDPTWDASAQGVSFGGFGLNLRTEDIARFGQLLLQRGRWGDRQLVPAAWIDEATARQMSNGSSPDSDWEQGYGYQFWRCRHGFFRGDGAHGQFCIVLPQYDAVVAITSGTRDMAGVMNLVWDRLVPALQADALPANPAAQRALADKLAHLSLPTPQGAATTRLPIAGKQYIMDSDRAMVEWVVVQPPASDGGDTVFTLRIHGAEHRVTAGHGRWQKGELPGRDGVDAIATAGAWITNDTYVLKLWQYRRPNALTYRLHFEGDTLAIDGEMNIGPDPRTFHLTGHAAK